MPATQIRTNRNTRKKYPLGTAGHYEYIRERRAERSLDVQMNRGIQQLKREKMGIPSDQPMYAIGSHVATIGGTSGRIVGSAQYVTGWEYQILPDKQSRHIYREEWQIRGLNPGDKPVLYQSNRSIYSRPQESEKLGTGYRGKTVL